MNELRNDHESNHVKCVHAEFVWTEPHSQRIKLNVKIQKEVQANPDQWIAAVQLWQHVSHRCTFFYLEQLILRHGAAARAIRIKQIDQDAQVALVSDFGKNDTIFSIRTHLGHLLNPGDYAIAPEESWEASWMELKSLDMEIDDKGRLDQEKMNSEYEQFLKDLEENPDLRFNMSLKFRRKFRLFLREF
ncbi:hypothetical protein L6164_033076 [Bauhinia variegata]|uniref:Uncharacterized protein n=1 Tax=Bauhinia variegata TaxID=167791 RepID=A0ACB9KR34_BAUVA|nr:hypothetical protein L6164_033076 [Bauhinia variegata]